MRNNNKKNNNKYSYDTINIFKVEKNHAPALRKLAEAIVLQAIEDFWTKNKHERRGSFAFFLGNGFLICSEIACITVVDRSRLVSLIANALRQRSLAENVIESISLN